MTDNKKLKEIIERGKDLVCASGAQIVSFDKELKKIEDDEKIIWKKLSYLL